MLKKILKYDLKWTYKVVAIFYILSLIFSLVARTFASIDNSVLFFVLSKIFTGAAISMMVSSLVNNLMRCWVRFLRNIYQDEGYLTNTLPVEKRTIYLSKVLSAIITTATTVIVILLCLFICYYSKSNLDTLKTSLELAASTYDLTVINFLLIMAVTLFLEILFILLVGYISIIIGHRANHHKLLKSIIWGFSLYLLTQALTLGITYLFGLINQDIMNLINTTSMVNIDAIKLTMLGAIILYSIYNITYYFVGLHIFQKGINID